MLLVLAPGTSTQWIPPRWLFGGPQNCETSPARRVSWIHWVIHSVSSHHITHTHYTSTWHLLWSTPALIQAKFITLEQNQAHRGSRHEGVAGCETRETDAEFFGGVTLGDIARLPKETLDAELRALQVCAFVYPKKPGFHFGKVGQTTSSVWETTGKGIAIDLHPGEETHWIQLNCMKEDHAETYHCKRRSRKNSIHFLTTAFTISDLYLGVGLHILNPAKRISGTTHKKHHQPQFFFFFETCWDSHHNSVSWGSPARMEAFIMT